MELYKVNVQSIIEHSQEVYTRTERKMVPRTARMGEAITQVTSSGEVSLPSSSQ